ncbi:hydrogenase maturation nickel metallochaperone HypA [Sphaerisporangium sp. NPDC051017]|uniref:hydrogenase maturation nickel metallochaperone HypA n=1 Tax=unclassified Sphaerisporangium TaxID=2630420 RepID=UPI003402F726
MHELSICRSIAGIVTEHADERPVRTVHVQVGHLRQIVPDTLVYCWSIVIQGTALDGSELRVESIPARIRCTECEHAETLTAPVMRCGSCGSPRVSIVAGEEFLITSLELAEA